MRKYKVLGAQCFAINNKNDAVEYIEKLIDNKKGGYSIAINAEKINMYSTDSEVKDLIDGCVLPIPDGSGAILGMKLLHNASSIKIDLPKTIFETCSENNYSMYVLGASENVNARAYDKLKENYSGIKLLGRRNGFYEDESEVICEIQRHNPQVVMIAMGSPKQEKFALKLNEKIPSALLIGCGGALNILSGEVKRAPEFYQDNHLEWFYRLMQDPSRYKRQLGLPKFLWKLLKTKYIN